MMISVGGELARFCQERKSHDMLFLCEVLSLYYFNTSIVGQDFEAHLFGPSLPGVSFDPQQEDRNSRHANILFHMIVEVFGECTNSYLHSFVIEKDSAWYKSFYGDVFLISKDCIKENPPRGFIEKIDQFFKDHPIKLGEHSLTEEQIESILTNL